MLHVGVGRHLGKNPSAVPSTTNTYVNLNEFRPKHVNIPGSDAVDADLLEGDEAPSREALDISEEPDIFIDFPLLTETHPPGGIPHQCEDDLLCSFSWYKTLRSSFLISGNTVFQSGLIRGYLGLYHERFLHLLAFPYIIHPFSNFYWSWNLLLSLILMISLIYEPYLIAFDCFTFVDPLNRRISLTVSLILLADCLLTFRVGCLDKATVVVFLDPLIIRKRYLGGGFWYDLITRLPFDYLILICTARESLGMKTGLTWIRLVGFTFKIFRLGKLYKVVVQLTKSLNMNMWTSQITTHGFVVAFCIHWGACLHWLLPDVVNAYSPQPKAMSWITGLGLWDKPRYFQYLNAFLRSLGNLLKLDGGEFIPREKEEIFCTSMLIIVAVSLFGYFVSTFSTMMMEFSKEDNRYREMVGCVHEYLKFRRIPLWFRERIYAYFDGKYKGRCFRENQLLETVSQQLRTELLHHNCRRLVENVYLFKNMPMSVMLNLIQRLTYEVYIPGDVVLSPYVNIAQIVFIEGGYFGVMNEFGVCTQVLEHGDFFGEVALLCPELPRQTSTVALSVTQVYKLSKKDYFQCMEQFPEVHERVTAVAQAKISREVRKFERKIGKAQKAKQWKEVIMQGKKTIEEYYADLDAGRIPSHHIAPADLEMMHYQNYKRTLEKVARLHKSAKNRAANLRSSSDGPIAMPGEVWSSSRYRYTSSEGTSTGMGTGTTTGSSDESAATRPNRATR